MVITFNAGNQGKAQLAASNLNATIIVWGLANFWLSTGRSVETTQGAPPAGFNTEIRDGIYCVGAPQGVGSGPTPQPLSLSWKGDLWVCNGTGPLDQQNNAVFIQVMTLC